MKNFIILTFSFLFSTLGFSQDNLCESSYMPFQEGTSLTYTNYDRKGKETGSQRQSVIQMEDTDGGFTATMAFTLLDKKGNEEHESSFEIKCDGGSVYMDMSNMVPASMLEQYQEMDAEITGEDIQFPNDPQPGQELPDGEMTVKASMGGLGSMSTTIRLVNRKVEGFEDVETPAGTFQCVKISQETVAEVMGMKNTSKSTSWLAKGIGTVKTESYSKHDKLQSSMVLTELKK